MSFRPQATFKAAATVLLATAVSSTAMVTSSPASAADDILIGAILPLTGPAAPTGVEEQRGVQFAEAQINKKGGIRGRKIKIIYEDSQAKPDQAILSFNRLTDLHNVQATLTAFSSVSTAIAPLATRKKVLVVNPAAQTNRLQDVSPFLINTIPLVKDEAAAVVKFVWDTLKLRKAGLIYENAAAGIDGRDDFKKAFLALGGAIVAEEPVEFGQTNYRPMLLKVAATNPDFLYIAMTQGHEPLAEQVGQLDKIPLGVGTTFANKFFGFDSTLGWYHSGIHSVIDPETEAQYAKMFPGVSAESSRIMGFFEREYYNATNIILKGIEKTLGDGKELTGENIRDAIFEIGTFEGTDTIKFVKGNNTASRSVEILRLDKGKRTRVQ